MPGSDDAADGGGVDERMVPLAKWLKEPSAAQTMRSWRKRFRNPAALGAFARSLSDGGAADVDVLITMALGADGATAVGPATIVQLVVRNPSRAGMIACALEQRRHGAHGLCRPPAGDELTLSWPTAPTPRTCAVESEERVHASDVFIEDGAAEYVLDDAMRIVKRGGGGAGAVAVASTGLKREPGFDYWVSGDVLFEVRRAPLQEPPQPAPDAPVDVDEWLRTQDAVSSCSAIQRVRRVVGALRKRGARAVAVVGVEECGAADLTGFDCRLVSLAASPLARCPAFVRRDVFECHAGDTAGTMRVDVDVSER